MFIEAGKSAASLQSRGHWIWLRSSWKSIGFSDSSWNKLHLKCTGFSPMARSFHLSFLDSGKLWPKLLFKTQLSYLLQRLTSRWLRWCHGVACLFVHNSQARVRPVSAPHSVQVTGEIQGWVKRQGSQDTSLCAVGIGLIDLTNKITRCPVQLECQINDQCLFSITQFRAILGLTNTNNFLLFL